MSELEKTIERLELWADHLEPHFMTPFIADVLTLIGAAKAVSRAVEMLQTAQRYLPKNSTEMERCTDGDYVDTSDLRAAIDILQEGHR